MTVTALCKANELIKDIENINKILNDDKKQRWTKVISADHQELFYSVRFQKELAEWLELKLKEYQKEFDEL